MTYQVRPLGPEDQQLAWDLGSLAFGYHERPMPDGWVSDSPGRHTLGVFDPAGRMVAKAVDREQDQWFGGRVVPVSGVAGVATAAELRGRGLGRLVLTRLLQSARERGAVLSSLFDTTPAPYRALGWEEVGVLVYHRAQTRVLAEIRPDSGTTLRPAAEADLPAVDEIYREVARTGTGMMERSGPAFAAAPAERLAEHHGFTVAVDGSGTVVGFARWDRGPGYDAGGRLTVEDLIGLTPAATRTLLAMLGGWASVAPTVLIRLGGADPVWSLLARGDAAPESAHPWMLRVVDAPGAVAARGWPPHLTGEVDLDLADDVCPWHQGRHRLVLGGGHGRLEPGGAGIVRLTPRGLASWYAGGATPQQLRRSGLLAGGDTSTDEFLRAATAGPVPTLHDYF
ncbi:GNAT family N-acetyltransferase [Actinoplanes sichuanensis]|uniref:Enhanced intracellular survival protein Eis n=1 Tax=Actinoplanes sichuanensis TaxID=512349 RepID=A0ABW4AR08_9ACTN|nr:GNAT family N-acetyltransferase [Actinoplanes sichuanensis]BEL05062.1 GNAT family N-acetyltransferase [Actinoplanes sichuanensis]